MSCDSTFLSRSTTSTCRVQRWTSVIRRACSGISDGSRLIVCPTLSMRPSSMVLMARAESPSMYAVTQTRLRLVRLVLDRDGQQRVGLRVEQVVDAGGDRLEPDRGDDPQPGRLGPERHAHRLPRPGLPLLRLGPLGVATPLQLAERRLRLGQLPQERLVRFRVVRA